MTHPFAISGISGALLLLIVSLSIVPMVAGLTSPAVFEAEPRGRVAIGQLELVATLPGDQPAGVAVSEAGRIFVTFPRHDGQVSFTVGEIKNGKLGPFPDANMNRAAPDRADESYLGMVRLIRDRLDAKEEGDGVTTRIAKVCEVRKITPPNHGRG